MNPPLDVRLVRKSQVEMRPFETGAVLVDMRSGACFELNRTGVEVWGMLETAHTIESISAKLAERYRIAPEAATADVGRLMEALTEQGLVTVLASNERPT